MRVSSEGRPLRFWVVKGRPDENDWDSVLRPNGKARWHTKAPPKTWSAGDGIFFYSSTPDRFIVGLGRIASTPSEADDEGECYFPVTYLTRRLKVPVTMAELRQDAIVQDALFLKQGPTKAVFDITPRQALRIGEMILANNPNTSSLSDLISSWATPGVTAGQRQPQTGRTMPLADAQTARPKAATKPLASPQAASLPDAAAEVTFELDDLPAVEGERLQQITWHRQRERWKRDQRISYVKAKNGGRLICEVPRCGFSFLERYGEAGRDYAQVHHLDPLSSSEAPRETKLDRLRVVCANCHVMIHRGGECRELDTLIPFRDAGSTSAAR